MKYTLKANLPHDHETCLGWILNSRGITDTEKYVNPTQEDELDPSLLKNIAEGARMYLNHISDNNCKTVILVDADCDGFMSAATIWLYSKQLNPDADLHYICHEHKAHGVEDVVDELVESDYDFIIVPDAGSSSKDLHQRLAESGKDILVIDHHIQLEDDPYAIVINNQSSDQYENKTLCGAGVVYKFCEYIDSITGNDFAKRYIDLCAVAEIGDCMSFKHPETRYYVVEGLKRIRNGGLEALINQQSFSLFKNTTRLTSIGVAFYIVPLINAVVRAGTMEEKRELFHMFIEPDLEVQSTKRGAKPGDMVPIGEEMSRIASNIRARQNRVKDKAVELLDSRLHKQGLLDNKIIILEVEPADKIPQELTGLICQQFVTRYNRPAMLVRRTADGYLKGSQRGRDNFDEVPDFRQFLLDSGLMDEVPGHANASGVSLLISKKEDLLKYANSHISEEGLNSSYMVDYIFSAQENYSKLATQLAEHEDLFGNDIETPTVVAEKIPLDNYMIMGENKDSFKFTHNGVEYVKFKDATFVDEIRACEEPITLTVYGRLGLNKWQGRVTPQLIIDDYDINIIDEYEF